MKKYLILLIFLCVVGCGSQQQETTQEENSYQQISAEEAKRMMDEQSDEIVLDVREQSEFDAGHIPGAVLLPVGSIDKESAAAVIPAKDTVVLVYCRSGNRSKKASATLVELGYTQVYEFGGIQEWPYDVEK